MSVIKAKIRDGYVNKNGESAIYIETFLEHRRLRMDVGIRVAVKYFDIKSGMVRASHPMADEYNMLIRKLIGDCNSILIKYRLQGRPITIDILTRELRDPSIGIDFIKYMESEVDKREGNIAHGTFKHHRSVINKLRKYRASILFSDMTYEFLEGFEKDLRHERRNNLNTIGATMKILKTYLNRAIKDEIITRSPFDKYKPRKSKTERTALTSMELATLRNIYREMKTSPTRLDILRHFLFCCYTGLRISDLKALRAEHINNGVIRIAPKKLQSVNNEIVKIPLNSMALDLIRDENPHRVLGPVFECYADQYANRELKAIMKEAGIEKDISFHCARHTFATLFLEATNDVVALQRILGHASIEMTMIYVHMSEKRVRDQMILFEKMYK